MAVWIDGLSASALPRETPVLSQRNIQFSSQLMVVVIGQTVDMPNEDDVAHNVYSSSSAKPFNLGIYPKGGTRHVTFDRVGTVDVRCSIHRRMTARIVVVPNSYYALTAIGSRYQITNVPRVITACTPGRRASRSSSSGSRSPRTGISSSASLWREHNEKRGRDGSSSFAGVTSRAKGPAGLRDGRTGICRPVSFSDSPAPEPVGITIQMLDQMVGLPGDLGPLPPVPVSADNPQDEAKIDLGRKLFFDPVSRGTGSRAVPPVTTRGRAFLMGGRARWALGEGNWPAVLPVF